MVVVVVLAAFRLADTIRNRKSNTAHIPPGAVGGAIAIATALYVLFDFIVITNVTVVTIRWYLFWKNINLIDSV